MGGIQLNINIVLVFATALAVYVKTLHPSLPGGDSGELIVAAYENGVAHPPGYPLFTLLAKLMILCVSTGPIAWRVNLLTAVCAASCASVLYWLIFRLTDSHGASVFGVGFFSFSRLVWNWSVTAEVFALNNLLVSSLMLVAVLFDSGPKESQSQLSVRGAFLCGLCLSNQHTSVLYVGIIIVWALYHLWQGQHLTLWTLLKLAIAFLVGLSTYAYLPVSSVLRKARWTWGDQSTVKGFLTHLLRVEYGTWDLLKDHSGQGFLAGLISYLQHCVTDLSVCVSVLAGLSLIHILYRYRKTQESVMLLFLSMLVVYISFFCWRANLDIENPLFFRVVERFWMQSDIIVIVLAAVAFSEICRFLSTKLKISNQKLELAVAVPLIASHLYHGWSLNDHTSSLMVRDFAVQSLLAFPTNSIVLTKGDLPSNSFRYFHLCENIRPDLTVFDQEVLTYEWSLPMTRDFYPEIIFPGDLFQSYSGVRQDGRRAFRFKDLIDANYDRHPIFACIGVQDHESSWEESYTLWPFGVCWQIVKKGTVLDVDRWTNLTSHIADQWAEPLPEVSDGSWDYVANSEMWRAKTSTALFYLELAMSIPEGQKESRELLLHSFQLYTLVIEKHPTFPAHWHRNYAIVCERLTRAGTSLDQVMLLKKTVHHFKKYLERAPDDQDAPKITNAVKTLDNYLESLGKP